MTNPTPVAIITGASSGIGLAAARALASRGYRLALNARDRVKLERAASEFSGSKPLVIAGDMSIAPDVHRLVDITLESLGRIDVLINNAGVGWNAPIPGHTPEMIQSTFNVNASGPALAIALAWAAFERQRSGCIINVSSIASLDPFPGFFAYAASKAALDMLTKVAAQEGAALNIRAFSVAPGAVETPLLRATFDEAALPKDQALRPEDVAALILDCIEGRRDADNGRVIDILPENGAARIATRA